MTGERLRRQPCRIVEHAGCTRGLGASLSQTDNPIFWWTGFACWAGPFILSAGLVRLFCLLVHIPPSSSPFLFHFILARDSSFSPCSDIDPSMRREDRVTTTNRKHGVAEGGRVLVSYSSHSHSGSSTTSHPVKSACPHFPYAFVYLQSTAMYAVDSHDNNKDLENFRRKSNLGKGAR